MTFKDIFPRLSRTKSDFLGLSKSWNFQEKSRSKPTSFSYSATQQMTLVGNTHMCQVLHVRTIFGDESFQMSGPRLWNSLSSDMHEPDIELSTFSRLLMTFCLRLWLPCIVTSCFHILSTRTLIMIIITRGDTSVYGRFPDGYFPGWFFSRKDVSRKVVSRTVIFPDRMFPGKMIPGWSLSRKDVSRVVIFPDETFPGNTSWIVGLMFNCSWRWTLTERPYCVYLNRFTVNSPHCQFAPLTNSSKVNMGRVGIQCYQVPVVSNIK